MKIKEFRTRNIILLFISFILSLSIYFVYNNFNDLKVYFEEYTSSFSTVKKTLENPNNPSPLMNPKIMKILSEYENKPTLDITKISGLYNSYTNNKNLEKELIFFLVDNEIVIDLNISLDEKIMASINVTGSIREIKGNVIYLDKSSFSNYSKYFLPYDFLIIKEYTNDSIILIDFTFEDFYQEYIFKKTTTY